MLGQGGLAWQIGHGPHTIYDSQSTCHSPEDEAAVTKGSVSPAREVGGTGPGKDVPRCLASIIRSIQSSCSGEKGVASGSNSGVAPGVGSTGGDAILNCTTEEPNASPASCSTVNYAFCLDAVCHNETVYRQQRRALLLLSVCSGVRY